MIIQILLQDHIQITEMVHAETLGTLNIPWLLKVNLQKVAWFLCLDESNVCVSAAQWGTAYGGEMSQQISISLF